jgi:hypothetical protein
VKATNKKPRVAKWQSVLLQELMTIIEAGSVGIEFDEAIRAGCGIHLAVFVEPYLSLVLEGKKTIESRFSLNRQSPFERVFVGDILLLKRSSGPIEGLCLVSDSWFYRLKPETWLEIEKFRRALCMDDSPFWLSKRKALYGSLMRVFCVERLDPISAAKLDPRGWVTLRERTADTQGDLF